MQRSILLLSFFSITTVATAQVTCTPNGSSGSGYNAFTQAGFGIETPDCVHPNFGAHVTQVFDEILQKNAFEFHSHIEADNDRCQVFDRVRMEVKGGPNTDTGLQHTLNSTAFYRWKFYITKDYVGSSRFHHIFQLKAKDGDDSFPVLTLTLRTNTLEVRHSGGDSGASLNVLVQENLERFKGRWIEAYMKFTNNEEGEFEVSLRDLLTDTTLIEYSIENIDLWRMGATYNRPKWGLYRAKAESLKDESFRFTDFCVSESTAGLCPADSTIWVDEIAPSSPTNLIASNVMISSLDLSWDAAEDAFGVSHYQVFQNGTRIWEGAETNTTISDLEGSTSYKFSVLALDAAGNQSEFSDTLNVTTDDATALPSPPSNPNPANNVSISPNSIQLWWTVGENTDSTSIYFGTAENPTDFEKVEGNSYAVNLEENTQYFWQVIHSNTNGVREGPIWTFSTVTANADAPWLVYRANDRMDRETNFFEPNSIPDQPVIDRISDDPNGSDNKIYTYRHDDDERFQWRFRFESTDTAFTVVARVKALEDLNCTCFFELRGFGFREKVRVYKEYIRLERTSQELEKDISFRLEDDFHLFRITRVGKITTVYIDENPVPFLTGESNESNASSFFEWGKSNTTPCGASIDWLTILENAAYAPNEGAVLPSDLFLSSDASLSSIEVDGVPILDFDSKILEYEIDIGTSTTVPQLNFSPTSDLATVVVDLPESVPDTKASIEVTAQDGFTKNTYVINFVKNVSSVESLAESNISVFPNPASEQILITSTTLNIQSIRLVDPLGRALLFNTKSKSKVLDVSDLAKGIYVLLIEKIDGKMVRTRVVIE